MTRRLVRPKRWTRERIADAAAHYKSCDCGWTPLQNWHSYVRALSYYEEVGDDQVPDQAPDRVRGDDGA